MSYEGKGVALVTGASQGIGKAIALRLASDGFDVAVNDLPSKAANLESVFSEIKIQGRRSIIVLADVSQESEVKEMVDRVADELGSLDVMVANAGILIMKSLLDTTVEIWDKVFSVNVRGMYLCYKYAAARMIAQGRGGRIVGASSEHGKQGGPIASAYSASKFAIRGLTQASAKELGKHNITVNAYAPGTIDTPMIHAVPPEILGELNELGALQVPSALPGGVGSASDIASTVSFLVSKDAGFITGQTITVNGGRYMD